MNKAILDDELRAKLNGPSPTTQVCDATGKIVGYFLTPDQFEKLMYAWVKDQYTDEQADRAWDSYLRNGGVSSREAWERVRARLGAREGAA